MTSEAEERLLHPVPGSAIEAAQKFGVDLTLLVERLRMTPEERLRALQRAMAAFDRIRGAARRANQQVHD